MKIPQEIYVSKLEGHGMKMRSILYTLLITYSTTIFTMDQSQKDHLQKKRDLARIDTCFASFLEHIKCGELREIQQQAAANGYAQFINWQDADWRTPLWYAVSNRHIECVAYLLEKKADIHMKDRWNVGPLDVAKPALLSETGECQKILELLQPKQG